ncbi:MAG: DUF4013 domain-containing protein [Candidatus Bathyarchaeia archaeon]|jgi:hypothetical protein
MLTSEFKNAYQYTRGLITKDQLILIIACLIPFLNIFVLIRYVDKIVREPSNSIKPPRLVKPNWTELVMSILKIAAVAAVWGVIAVALMMVIGLACNIGLLGGATSMMNFIEESNPKVFAAALGSIAVFCAISIFGVMSEVNMLKSRNFMAAFAFKDLLSRISRIGWVRYILFIVTLVVTWLIVVFIGSQIGNFLEIGYFTVSLVGILALLPVTFLARTISLLYDQYYLPPPPPPP